MEKGLLAFSEDHDAASIAEGMHMTHDQLVKVLHKYHVEVIDPMGQPFDPNQHEALAMQPSDEHKPNTVMQVIQKGYRLKGRVVRAARVIVAKAG